jgi:hypothetical protein
LILNLVWLPATAAVLQVPESFATIQAAINAANSGDEVEVDIGTYIENLTLRSNIEVRSVEAAQTFLTAADDSLAVVTANGINDVLFSNFTFISSANGIEVIDSTNITLANNVFGGLTTSAITVGVLADVQIENNVFYQNNRSINRFTTAASIGNNIFSENLETIVSGAIPIIDPDTNVSFNCFYLNADLADTGGSRGTNFQTGDPLFTDTSSHDFHLRQSSPCIDTGTGTDIIDDSTADIGAYGGQTADARPFPVARPSATDTSTSNPTVFNIQLNWDANRAYLVTNTVLPGSYNVWYRRNRSGPPYDGTDAGNGTEPSPIDASDVTSFTLRDLQPRISAPGTPVLKSADPENDAVDLSWTAVSGADGYRVYYGTGAVTDNTIEVGNVTGHTVTGLTNGVEYLFAVAAVKQPSYHLSVTAVDSTTNQNQSDFAVDRSIDIGDPVEGTISNELPATPETVVPVPNLPDEGCFIATAAFGADWVAELQVLRSFRDRFLLTHAPGRGFVAWYYRVGPQAAAYLNKHARFKPLVRASLWPLIMVAAFMLGTNLLTQLLTVSLSVALVVAVRRLRHANSNCNSDTRL